MLSTTGFVRQHLSENDVKLLLIEACIQCECDRVTIVYAIDDVDRFTSHVEKGDVALWVLTNDYTNTFVGRILSEKDAKSIRLIKKHFGIKKMYRIERMTADFDIVELKFNK
ncbi:MAG: hypothetical protein II260_05270 [Muribaculaceae bacterium]|nr:hypothetical protein [Muribaculaceae bacterium]